MPLFASSGEIVVIKNGLPHSELTPVTIIIDNKSIETEIIIVIIVIAGIIIAETILIHFSLLMPFKVL